MYILNIQVRWGVGKHYISTDGEITCAVSRSSELTVCDFKMSAARRHIKEHHQYVVSSFSLLTIYVYDKSWFGDSENYLHN